MSMARIAVTRRCRTAITSTTASPTTCTIRTATIATTTGRSRRCDFYRKNKHLTAEDAEVTQRTRRHRILRDLCVPSAVSALKIRGGFRSAQPSLLFGTMTDPPSFLIRPAKPADADAVSALLMASYSSLLAARSARDLLSRVLPQ